MAGGNPPLGNPLGTRYVERFLRQLFNPVGLQHFGTELRGPIQPSVDVRPRLPQDFSAFGVITWSKVVTVGAVAAEHSYVEVPAYPLNVPPGQPMDLLIYQVRASAPGDLRVMATTIGDAVTDNVQIRDSFWGALTSSYPGGGGFIVTGTALPAAFTGSPMATFLAGETLSDVPFILRAGTAGVVVIRNGAVNSPITVDIHGMLIPVTVSGL